MKWKSSLSANSKLNFIGKLLLLTCLSSWVRIFSFQASCQERSPFSITAVPFWGYVLCVSAHRTPQLLRKCQECDEPTRAVRNLGKEQQWFFFTEIRECKRRVFLTWGLRTKNSDSTWDTGLGNWTEIEWKSNRNRTEIEQKLNRNWTKIEQKLNGNWIKIELKLNRNGMEIEDGQWKLG